MTDTMRCGVCISPGTFSLSDAPVPTSAPDGWALVDIKVVGLCGTDYHIYGGKHPFLEYPRVIGHELGGRLALDAGGMKAGTLVSINPYLACGTCRACARGKPNCCYNIEVLGVHRDGGMCARIAVPVTNLFVADGLTDIQAAMVEFLAIGAHAVARAEITPGDRVIVSGAGPIGLGTALFARIAGAEVHLLDIDPNRRDMVMKKFGFESGFDSVDAALEGDHADGFDVVFDATGNAQAIEAGFALLAHGSSYVLVSVVKDDISFNDAAFHKRETRIIGSRNAHMSDFEAVANALRDGAIDAKALCSVVMDLDTLVDRFDALAHDRSDLIKACVRIDD